MRKGEGWINYQRGNYIGLNEFTVQCFKMLRFFSLFGTYNKM
jgi:hypothetical protein